LDDNLMMEVDLNPDHTLGVPPLSAPRMLGWYRGSPVPGDAAVGKYPQVVERSVVLGHINADHVEGAFADLSKVKIGTQIIVSRSDNQTATFKVTKVLIVAKSAFPTEQTYGHASGPELVAITCGPGDLDTTAHNYLQQTIVFAKLVSLKPTSP
jgi:LPXTG-site transpeptidase (sortase) family protein